MGGVSNFEGKEAVQYELSIQLFRVPAFVYQFQRGIFQYNLTLFVIFQKIPYTGRSFEMDGGFNNTIELRATLPCRCNLVSRILEDGMRPVAHENTGHVETPILQ